MPVPTPKALAVALVVAATLSSATAFAQGADATTARPATDARAFLDDLANRAFALLRDSSVGEAQRRAAFRTMLRDNFALQQIGDRLIRHHRAEITPQQYATYQSVFPNYVIDAYAGQLEGFANAKLQTIRSVARADGGTDVFARVTMPGRAPLDTIWGVKPSAPGHYLVTNFTVSGVNLVQAQGESFDALIQRQGFDALIAFMRRPPATRG